MNLSSRVKRTRVANAAAGATTDINSSSVDMQGFRAVEFVVAFGAITAGAVTSCKLQGSSDDSTWSDLTGATVTIADDDDNKVAILDCAKPRHRYIRCVVDRGTQNAVLDGIVAQQYMAQDEPVTHDATTVAATVLKHAPAAA